MARKWHTPELKEWWYTKFSAVRREKTRRLSEAQNHRCAFCQCDTWIDETDKKPGMRDREMATLEHVKPQSEGGTDHWFNIVMACKGCNNRRGSMHWKQFMKLITDPVFRLTMERSVRENKIARSDRKAAKKLEQNPHKEARLIYRLAVTAFLFPEFSKKMSELQNKVDTKA